MQKLIVGIICCLLSQYSFPQKTYDFRDLKPLIDSIKQIVQRENITGLMLGIATPDSVLYSGGFGYADIEAKRPVTRKTLFRMASITKMFVALEILRLVDEGKLGLYDELKKVAPEIPFQNKWEASDPVRIINLLEHTAGFDDIKLNHFCSVDTTELSTPEMVLLQQHSLVCRWRPGERFAYSNPGYVLLGYILEKINGRPYTDIINQHILRPLGMIGSNFNLSSKIPGEDTRQYLVEGGHIKKVPSVTLLAGPAGALWSNADDMVRFVQLFLKHGQPIFPETAIKEMETTHSSLAARAGLKSGYALANADMFIYGKYPWRGHRGLLGTCFSTLSYNQNLGVGFILSSNGNQPNLSVENAIIHFFEQDHARKILDTIRTDLKAIEPFLGQYQFENPRNEISGFKDRLLNIPELFLEDQKLYFKPLFERKIRLVQIAPFIFAKEGTNTPTIVFTKNKDGKNIVIIDGGYFEQTYILSTLAILWCWIAAVICIISSFFAGIMAIIKCLLGKQSVQKLPFSMIPMVAASFLVWAIVNLSEVIDKSYLLAELTNINPRTMIIFFGTFIFGILSLIDLLLVILKFNRLKNRWDYFYWTMTAASLCFISVVLFQNGWIGLRTWAM